MLIHLKSTKLYLIMYMSMTFYVYLQQLYRVRRMMSCNKDNCSIGMSQQHKHLSLPISKSDSTKYINHFLIIYDRIILQQYYFMKQIYK